MVVAGTWVVEGHNKRGRLSSPSFDVWQHFAQELDLLWSLYCPLWSVAGRLEPRLNLVSPEMVVIVGLETWVPGLVEPGFKLGFRT